MGVLAIVPQSHLRAAKTRLAVVLEPDARAALALQLLGRVCAALRATPAVAALTVVSPDPAVRVWGDRNGYAVTLDPGYGLNAALEYARRGARDPRQDVLIIAADLPWLRPADVTALLRARQEARVVLAPSKDGAGTNALALPGRRRFTPAVGAGSRVAHRREAALRGLEVIEVVRPGLAFDVDTPDDLRALSRTVPASAARRTPGPRYNQG
jgi:2-phospho-L-lactate guanylyltransferase